jgi:hypothetical protein
MQLPVLERHGRIVSAMSTMDDWPIGLTIMLTWLSSVAIYNDRHCCHPCHPHLHEANMNVRYKAESYKYCYGPFRTRDAYVNGLVWPLSLADILGFEASLCQVVRFDWQRHHPLF